MRNILKRAIPYVLSIGVLAGGYALYKSRPDIKHGEDSIGVIANNIPYTARIIFKQNNYVRYVIGTEDSFGKIDTEKPRLFVEDNNLDFRPENIDLKNVPRGHDLEKIANAESLTHIESELLSDIIQ